MASDMCVRRLTKELSSFKKDPIKDPRITIAPNERNILEIHYVIEGGKDTPYEGGVYHGKIIFPKEYPMKPPGIIMITPSGRFQPNRRLCLSLSDFHPESWNPLWSLSSILTGLYSFMIESKPTLGSIETSTRTKRKLAAASLETNVKQDPAFCKLFPEYVELYEREYRNREPETETTSSSAGSATSEGQGRVADRLDRPLWGAVAGIVAVLSIFVAVRFL